MKMSHRIIYLISFLIGTILTTILTFNVSINYIFSVIVLSYSFGFVYSDIVKIKLNKKGEL